MIKNDLQFLLKEKYKINELEVNKIVNGLVKGTLVKDDLLNYKLDIDNLNSDYQQLLEGYPVDYLIGYVDFINAKIDLSYKPLIPRPETEYWVYEFIKKHKIEQNLKILDIFAGSGCIGIAVLQEIHNSCVTFSEINEKFIKQIGLNIKINKISSERYEIIQSDLFNNLVNSKNSQFDYILANPPYVGKNDIHGASIKYEPKDAIFADDDGLEIIKRFLSEAHKFYTKALYLEINEFKKTEVVAILKEFGYKDFEFFKDQYGKYRWVEINTINVVS